MGVIFSYIYKYLLLKNSKKHAKNFGIWRIFRNFAQFLQEIAVRMAIIYPIYLMKKKKIILISEIAASLVLAILLAVAGYHAYRLMGSNFVSRDGKPHYVYVYPETTLDSLISSLQADYKIG